jgi:hypothetical protein
LTETEGRDMSLELEVLEELTLTIRILLLEDKEYINGFFSLKTKLATTFPKSASEYQINYAAIYVIKW